MAGDDGGGHGGGRGAGRDARAPRRGLASQLLAGARHALVERVGERLAGAGPEDGRTREVGLRVLDQAERVMIRLEGVAVALETAARLEVQLLERMVPIVEDLGELVRHTLDDARERRGLAPRGRDGGRPARPGEVIDVDARDADG